VTALMVDREPAAGRGQAPPATVAQRRALASQILAHHSKSFWWGALLLPEWCRRDAAALYAWCRRCDDAVDVPRDPAVARHAVARLRAELDTIYRGDEPDEPVLAGFAEVMRRHQIPRQHPSDLIDGMAMDIGRVRYQTFEQLLPYCYRVAGTVGVMMAHIMGVRDAETLRRAAELGMAMQLTNISRDVAEDEERDRVYVPRDLWVAADRPPPASVADLLRRAEHLYRSGDRGIAALPWRCAAAVRAARLIYADIGTQLARRGFDFRTGRAVVPRGRKLRLAVQALLGIPRAMVSRISGRLLAGLRGSKST
jgi:phytoene synthase